MSTTVMELKLIDELLHCGICYEYMNTSVITSCSHSYCSLCIRKYLHYKTQCPTCYEQTYEKDLRKNKLLDEIIIHYVNFKEKCDKKLYREELPIVKDENPEIVCSANNFESKKVQDVLDAIETSPKSLDSPTLAASNTTPHGRKDYQQDISTPSTSGDLKIPLMFTPKSRKTFQREENCQVVICPVCKVEIPQININRHLDDCLKRKTTKNEPKKSKLNRKPLPKLVLSLMKDTALRKRMKQLGLSCQGDRKALESRLQRYTILYNAECDKTYPRPVSELIKLCEEEENLEKKVQKPSNRLNVNRNTGYNVIEQQRKKYLATNKDSFDQLIARIKHDNPQKISVKRNILNKGNSDFLHNDRFAANDLIIKDNQRPNVLSVTSTKYIEDSDSDASCPFQTYSSEDVITFLDITYSSSSNDSISQSTSNHDTSNQLYKTNSDLFKSVIKTENIKTEKLSSENVSIHEKITFNNQPKECDVLENEMDLDNKIISEFTKVETEDAGQSESTKSKSDMRIYRSNKYVYSEPESRNEDRDSVLVIENFEEDDNTDIQDNYNTSKHEQLDKAMKEYAADGTKSEKENVKALDQNFTFRKRNREVSFTLNDEDNVANQAINAKKSARLGLSEAKGFNNETFEETLWDRRKSQSEKEQSQIIRTNNITRKSARLKNKVSK